MSDQPRPRLRFGVLCPSLKWHSWQASSIRRLLDRELADLALLILLPDRRQPPADETGLFSLFKKVLRPRALDFVDVSDIYRRVPQIECSCPPGPAGAEDSHLDIQRRIDQERLDFIISFVGLDGILHFIRGGVPHGVWSFRVNEFSPFPGGRASFWGIQANRLTTQIYIDKLTPENGRTIILKEAIFRAINYSYAKNVDYIYAKASPWFSEICQAIIGQKSDSRDGVPASRVAQPAPFPGSLQVLELGLRLLKNRVSKFVHDFFMIEQWNIGVIRRPIEAVIEDDSPLAIEWLLAPRKKEVFADPFSFRAETPLVFFESFNRREDKGRISVTTLDAAAGRREISVCMDKPHHLSYPFVLEHEGEVYMVPEEWITNRITLYRAVRFPGEWQPVSVLVDDIAAVDTTLFHDGELWWLFCSPKEDDFTSTLLLFYAASLFGPYRPHARNPVKSDIRNSRPAGRLFKHKGMLIRPTQDSSESYGRRITLNRVLELSAHVFREETFKVLKPDIAASFNKGIHTINPLDDIAVIDGKRYLLSSSNLRQKVRRKLPRAVYDGTAVEAFQVINPPKKKEKRFYTEGLQAVSDALRQVPGIVALFQLGGTDSPGISDIDLLAVFEDSARVDYDAPKLLASVDRYLFTHNISGISRSDFLRTGGFDIWYRARRLWGEDLSPEKTVRSLAEEEAIRRQTALEFLVENYIDLTIQRKYGVLKLRSTLQHIKAIRLDLELLGITSGPVYEMVQQVRRWLGRWVENPIGQVDLWKWTKSFYVELEALVAGELRKTPLFIPPEANLKFSRNITLKRGESLGHRFSGVSLPPHLIGVNRRLFNVNTRLNAFVFDVPSTAQASQPCLEDRYIFYKKIKDNMRFSSPHFDPFITGFCAKIIS
jgi:hypothetical protein